MKNLLLVLLLLPAICFAQKIQVSRYDQATKQYIIETSNVQVKADLDDIFGFKILSQDTSIVLLANGVGGTARNISNGDPLVFIFSRRDSAVCTAMGDQGYKKGSFADNYVHSYNISKSELMKLQRFPIESVRMYTATGSMDIEVKPKRSELLKELAQVFLEEYNAKKK